MQLFDQIHKNIRQNFSEPEKSGPFKTPALDVVYYETIFITSLKPYQENVYMMIFVVIKSARG